MLVLNLGMLRQGRFALACNLGCFAKGQFNPFTAMMLLT